MNFPVYANIPLNSIMYIKYDNGIKNINLFLKEKYLNFDICIIGSTEYLNLNVYNEEESPAKTGIYNHYTKIDGYQYCNDNYQFNTIKNNNFGGWFIMFKFHNIGMLAKFKILSNMDEQDLELFYDM